MEWLYRVKWKLLLLLFVSSASLDSFAASSAHLCPKGQAEFDGTEFSGLSARKPPRTGTERQRETRWVHTNQESYEDDWAG